MKSVCLDRAIRLIVDSRGLVGDGCELRASGEE
jgi:hypothetical protein